MKADLAAGKVPPFKIGGAPKSPHVNPPIVDRSGVRETPPLSTEPLRKRPADKRVPSAKNHRSEDPATDGRRSSRRSGIDMSWSFHYCNSIVPISSDRRAAAELLQTADGPTSFLPEVQKLECTEAYETLALDIIRVRFYHFLLGFLLICLRALFFIICSL